jgi:hypothetical protein
MGGQLGSVVQDAELAVLDDDGDDLATPLCGYPSMARGGAAGSSNWSASSTVTAGIL